jgi:hypothetical protein
MSEFSKAELIKRELIDGSNMSKLEFCEHCIFGKHKMVNSILLFIPLKGY